MEKIKPVQTSVHDRARTTLATTNLVTPTVSRYNPDRWCYPRSNAMNTSELHVFKARLVRLTDRGTNPIDAEKLADRLVIRDREKKR